MKEQFPQSWKDQLETLDLIHSMKFRNRSSPLSMKRKCPGIPRVLVRHRLPSDICLKLKTQEGPTTLDFGPNTELAGQIFDVTKQWAEPLLVSRHNSSFQDLVKKTAKSNASKRTRILLGRLVGSEPDR